MKHIYEKLFPGCLLACKPKPWRIALLLELIYGGWTVIRTTVIRQFTKCKQVEYAILLNLLDNYLPTVLIMYGISFQTHFSKLLFASGQSFTVFAENIMRRHLWYGYQVLSHHYPELYQTFENNIATQMSTL